MKWKFSVSFCVVVYAENGQCSRRYEWRYFVDFANLLINGFWKYKQGKYEYCRCQINNVETNEDEGIDNLPELVSV